MQVVRVLHYFAFLSSAVLIFTIPVVPFFFTTVTAKKHPEQYAAILLRVKWVKGAKASHSVWGVDVEKNIYILTCSIFSITLT